MMLTKYLPDASHWCLHLMGGSVAFQSVFMLIGIGAGLAVILGWHTRWSMVLAWVLTVSLQNRNPVILYGGDAVLRMMTFWCLFMPMGACWSLDAKRSPVQTSNPHLSMASLAALMQIAFIYCFGALLKTGNDWTRDGTAVYNALMASQFVRTPGLWLLPHEDLCKFLTFGVWWLELLGPFIAFIPWRSAWWRILVILSMWLMHAGFATCLRIGYFGTIMMMIWLLFVPSLAWDALAKRWPRLGTTFQPSNAPPWPWQRIALESFLGFCLVIVTLWNLWTFNPVRWKLGPSPILNGIAQALRLDQNWSMFAPSSATDDGWMILDAELYDDSHIDLLRAGQPLTFDKPRRISSEYPDWKWHKFEVNLLGDNNVQLRQPFGDCIAREWSRKHPRVRSWTLWFIREETLPHFLKAKPVRIEVARNGMFVCP